VGKIIPALATTTSVIAGLATIELFKVVAMRRQWETSGAQNLRHSFVNLARPELNFVQPWLTPKMVSERCFFVILQFRFTIFNCVLCRLPLF
jgi:hypothetical protein